MAEEKYKVVQAAAHTSTEEMAELEKHLKNAVDGLEEAEALLIGLTPSGRMTEVAVYSKSVARILLEYNYPFYLASKKAAPSEMWQKLSELAGLSATANVVIKFAPNENSNTKTD